MAAIIRLKRKRNDEPADALLISLKKLKNGSPQLKDTSIAEENNSDSLYHQRLKFAGTLDSKNATLSRHIKAAINKEKLSKEYKKHFVDVIEKTRDSKKTVTKDNRYKVILSRREVDLDKLDIEQQDEKAVLERGEEESSLPPKCSSISQTHNKVFCLYDLERDSHLCSQPKDPTSEMISHFKTLGHEKNDEKEFVYDLYYTNSNEVDFGTLESSLTIQTLHEELIYDDDRLQEDENVYDDEDDSNDESNWRNDYPDEYHCFYDKSDNYGEDDDNEDDENDYDLCSYAAYKNRVREELGSF